MYILTFDFTWKYKTCGIGNGIANCVNVAQAYNVTFTKKVVP